MTREELEKSFRITLAKILCTKRKISRCTDAREKKKFERQLKELQYLQFGIMICMTGLMIRTHNLGFSG